MTDFIYAPPKVDLSPDKNGEGLDGSSLARSLLPFRKVMLLSIASTLIGVFFWVVLLFITIIALTLIDESIIDEMSNDMAVTFFAALLVPGSVTANIIVLLKFK